jgi:pyruvate, orthophosphate dikinase
LAYVSCSPFRVPVARLAAAQAALEEEADKAKAGLKGKSNGKVKIRPAKKLAKARF